jgi:hypothetical protein
MECESKMSRRTGEKCALELAVVYQGYGCVVWLILVDTNVPESIFYPEDAGKLHRATFEKTVILIFTDVSTSDLAVA